MMLLCSLGVGGCAFLLEDTGIPSERKQSATDLYNKALSYYQSGQYAEAKNLFHEYIGQFPDTPLFKVALYYLGHCYQMTGEEKEALVFYNRVVTTWGDDDFWGAQAMKRIKLLKGENDTAAQ